ncbi:hypothetical protein [Variovorax paradoxus]|uniref:hypothetical protein n=1 Tax=Variovorax paradoxus TaxID=34073 RepID=UPI003D653D76
MQKECDIYLCHPAKTDRLKFVSLFDAGFIFHNQKEYEGYLNINVKRIKLISVLTDLRRNGFECFSVPVEYRDCQNLPLNAALDLANTQAKKIGASVASQTPKCSPVFWLFDLRYENSVEKVASVVMIDRLDGHVWSDSEHEEYMYDYNSIF